MSRKDQAGLAARMKRYEAANSFLATPNTPIVIRVDGRAFHTYKKKIKHTASLLEDEIFNTELSSGMIEAAFRTQKETEE